MRAKKYYLENFFILEKSAYLKKALEGNLILKKKY